MDQALGAPSQQYQSIHIAGTNGKGTVSRMIYQTLRSAGKKVGLYTSPHISTFHERIEVDGALITDSEAEEGIRLIDRLHLETTFFELLTLLAFVHFAKKGVDVAVIEVGLGGRLDATNILSPLLSVITSIDFDHMHYLGDTIEKIAEEKAGIIKPHTPLLLGPHAKPISVFEKIAKERSAPLYQVQGDFAHFEEENRAVAKRAIELLPWKISDAALQEGLQALPSCRFMRIHKKTLVILDVAHNPAGIAKLLERIENQYRGEKVRFVAAFSADKAIDQMLSLLRQKTEAIDLAIAANPRAAYFEGVKSDPKIVLEKAYAQACHNGEILVVCGTFFIMDAAIAFFESVE